MPRKKKIFIDQRFTLPNIDENEYQYVSIDSPINTTTTWNEDILDNNVDNSDIIITDNTGTQDVTSTGSLDAPTNLVVITQNVHTGTAFTQVVDVTIEFNDVYGATKYNARYTKL